jgi:hypothetical protein
METLEMIKILWFASDRITNQDDVNELLENS